jgi:hypothetical protein
MVMLKSDSEAFIIRIWQENEIQTCEEAVWRGSITHVGSNQQLYFCDLHSVVDFINDQAGIHRRFRNVRLSEYVVRFYDWISELRSAISAGILHHK